MYNDPTYCYCEYLHRDLLFVTGSLKAHVSSLNGPNHQSHNVGTESATPPLRRRREWARRDKRGRKSHEGRRWRKRERDETWTNTPLEKYCRSWEGRRNVCLCRSFMPASVATGPDPESDPGAAAESGLTQRLLGNFSTDCFHWAMTANINQ